MMGTLGDITLLIRFTKVLKNTLRWWLEDMFLLNLPLKQGQ